MPTRRDAPKNMAARETLIAMAKQTREMIARLEGPTGHHGKIYDTKLRKLESGADILCSSWEVSEHLPIILWKWDMQYGHEVLVTGDGEILPVKSILDENRVRIGYDVLDF